MKSVAGCSYAKVAIGEGRRNFVSSLNKWQTVRDSKNDVFSQFGLVIISINLKGSFYCSQYTTCYHITHYTTVSVRDFIILFFGN